MDQNSEIYKKAKQWVTNPTIDLSLKQEINELIKNQDSLELSDRFY